jgi:protein-disulfide isomerase
MKSALIACLAALLVATSVHAQPGSQPKSYDIIGMDGTPVMNFVVPVETGNEIRKLPSVVSVGNPKGDVTIFEFYDLNCPYCRMASVDLKAMLAADKRLDLVLVPFPVLGIPSIQAGRVDFALAKMASPLKFYLFHQKMFSGRGVVDGERALAGAKELGFAREKVLAVANDEAITDAMKAHVQLGDALQMQATPSFVVQDVAIIGYPGRPGLEKIVRAVRQCGKAAC